MSQHKFCLLKNMSCQRTHLSRAQKRDHDGIETKRARGTLLPHEEPVVEDIPVGAVQRSRNHSDKNRLLI